MRLPPIEAGRSVRGAKGLLREYRRSEGLGSRRFLRARGRRRVGPEGWVWDGAVEDAVVKVGFSAREAR